MQIVKKKSTEKYHFYSCEKSLYIAWACLRNEFFLFQFTAMIRISENVPRSIKVERIHEIVDVLGLKDCLHTGK